MRQAAPAQSGIGRSSPGNMLQGGVIKTRVSLGVGVAAIVATILVGIGAQSGLAQGDPLIGTWVLNVAKSKYTPGPPPKEQTTTFEAEGKGVKVTTKGIDSAGKPTEATYTA